MGLPTKNLFLTPRDVIRIQFCTYDRDSCFTNDFYVNLESMMLAYQKFNSIVNVYSANASAGTNCLRLKDILADEMVLAFHQNMWHRCKKNSRDKLVCIDNMVEFEASKIIRCPSDLVEIPSFAIHIRLAGIHNTNFERLVVNEFLSKQTDFKAKIILINNKPVYFVEVLNDKNVSLNYLLNPEFQKDSLIYN
jgi:hypothetical protein